MRSDGNLFGRVDRDSVSVASSAASVSLSAAQRTLKRMAAQLLDEIGAPDHDPRLRPAEQLVAREAHEVGAGRQARASRRLVPDVDERAGAEVVDERQARAAEPPAPGLRAPVAP